MKWIPAVIFVAMFNCDEGPAGKPQTGGPGPGPDAAAATPAMPDVGATAKADVALALPADSAEQFVRPFLYEVTKKGNHRTSYIFGTINGKFDIDFERAPISVRQAMTVSSHAMFEVPTGSAAHRKRTKMMAMKKGSSRKELGRDRFKKLAKIADQPTHVLDVMKPWVLYMMLEEKLSGDPPMDELFEGFAQSYRKRLVYFETVREHVAVVESNVNWKTLSTLVDEFDEHTEAAEMIVTAYSVGNEKPIAAALFQPGDKRAEVYKKLNDTRLEKWVGLAEKQFSTNATFAVVGLRFLIAPNNLLAGLEAKGWKVERVKK